jgi:hypothetical protein
LAAIDAAGVVHIVLNVVGGHARGRGAGQLRLVVGR